MKLSSARLTNVADETDHSQMGVDFSKYERRAVEIDKFNFVIKHRKGGEDINTTMEIDKDSRRIEWEGLPRSISMNIEQDFDVVCTYPLMFINMAIDEQMENIEGLRPHSETADIVSNAIELRESDPCEEY